MKTRTPRTSGFVVHVGESRTAGFWSIIKDSQGTLYFAYGLSFLDPEVIPRVGWECGFTVLPPAPGHPLKRATEVQVLKSTRGGQITVERHSGAKLTELQI